MHLAPESRREGSFDVGSRSTHECLGMFDKKTGSEVTDFRGKHVSLVTLANPMLVSMANVVCSWSRT